VKPCVEIRRDRDDISALAHTHKPNLLITWASIISRQWFPTKKSFQIDLESISSHHKNLKSWTEIARGRSDFVTTARRHPRQPSKPATAPLVFSERKINKYKLARAYMSLTLAI
jgi:hypothetical protein